MLKRPIHPDDIYGYCYKGLDLGLDPYSENCIRDIVSYSQIIGTWTPFDLQDIVSIREFRYPYVESSKGRDAPYEDYDISSKCITTFEFLTGYGYLTQLSDNCWKVTELFLKEVFEKWGKRPGNEELELCSAASVLKTGLIGRIWTADIYISNRLNRA